MLTQRGRGTKCASHATSGLFLSKRTKSEDYTIDRGECSACPRMRRRCDLSNDKLSRKCQTSRLAVGQCRRTEFGETARGNFKVQLQAVDERVETRRPAIDANDKQTFVDKHLHELNDNSPSHRDQRPGNILLVAERLLYRQQRSSVHNILSLWKCCFRARHCSLHTPTCHPGNDRYIRNY